MSEQNTQEEKTLTNALSRILLEAIVNFRTSFEKLPGRVSYALNKTASKISSNWEIVEKERMTLLKTYCELDESDEVKFTKLTAKQEKENTALLEKGEGLKHQSTAIFKTEKDEEEFHKEYNELLKEDSSVDPHKIPLSIYSELELPNIYNLPLFEEWMVDENK